LSIKKHVK